MAGTRENGVNKSGGEEEEEEEERGDMLLRISPKSRDGRGGKGEEEKSEGRRRSSMPRVKREAEVQQVSRKRVRTSRRKSGARVEEEEEIVTTTVRSERRSSTGKSGRRRKSDVALLRDQDKTAAREATEEGPTPERADSGMSLTSVSSVTSMTVKRTTKKVVKPPLSIPPMVSSVTSKPSGKFRISSWNVNGLRSILRSEGYLEAYIEAEQPDVFCLNETKLNRDVEKDFCGIIPGYTGVFNTAEKKGYSGTAMFFRDGVKPSRMIHGIGIEEHDSEGRVLTAEFDNLFVVASYIPNSGAGLKRLGYRTEKWDIAMLDFLKSLSKSKPTMWLGDLNVAHLDIDIHDPKNNRNKSAGFCDEERDNMSNVLSSGFIDWWREQNPDVVGYTYWGYRFNLRARNKGMEVDLKYVGVQVPIPEQRSNSGFCRLAVGLCNCF